MAARRTPAPVSRALRVTGENVSSWRKLRRLTIEEVADRAGVSARTVMRLEAGGGTTLENLMRVARALGTLDLLVGALDPYATDLGRARADEELPERVRRRSAR